MTLSSDVGHVCVILCRKSCYENASWGFLRRYFEDFRFFLSIAVVEGVFFFLVHIFVLKGEGNYSPDCCRRTHRSYVAMINCHLA